MLPDDLKDFRAPRDDDSFALVPPDIAAALIFAALCALLIVERMGVL